MTSNPALAVKRPPLIVGGCVVLVALVITAVAIRYMPSSSARRGWKDRAIADISSRLADSAWVSNELAHFKATGTNDPSDTDGWLSERLIAMRNGDWLAYANICQKQDSRIRDLFLGRGSDGRWYYSTYHFCKGMTVLKMEEQSDDLSTFAKTYCSAHLMGTQTSASRKPGRQIPDEQFSGQQDAGPNYEERGQPRVPMRFSLARSSSSVSFSFGST